MRLPNMRECVTTTKLAKLASIIKEATIELQVFKNPH